MATFRRDFGDSLLAAVDVALHAEPHYLVLGFSLEHFSPDLAENELLPRLAEQRSGLAVATWAHAAKAALAKLGARHIAILCPFDPTGLKNAIGFFENLGFDVVGAAGLGCKSGTDVGHVPDGYKEKVIREQLLGAEPDAIVVSGTNLSSLALAERLEPELGIPIVGSNQTILWYSLRENGITAPLTGASRLLRDF